MMSRKVRELVGAKALGAEGWEPTPTAEHPLPNVICPCGWRGSVGLMLAVGDGDLVYCPQCHRHGYEGWTYD